MVVARAITSPNCAEAKAEAGPCRLVAPSRPRNGNPRVYRLVSAPAVTGFIRSALLFSHGPSRRGLRF